jgi:hypothetical protein
MPLYFLLKGSIFTTFSGNILVLKIEFRKPLQNNCMLITIAIEKVAKGEYRIKVSGE